MIVCTATATVDTKKKIFAVLNLNDETTVGIERSPERSNIVYSSHYIDNDLEFQTIVGNIIKEIQGKKDECTRTVIYCQTRKQTAVIWRAFKLALGKNFLCQ
jgi:superfamily II DNA helicase RecQ